MIWSSFNLLLNKDTSSPNLPSAVRNLLPISELSILADL